MNIQRKAVSRSARIVVTEKLICSARPTAVLELGAGDFSFESVRRQLSGTRWTKADFSPPGDVLCDFNRPDIHLPFADASFDMVIVTELLEHLLWPHLLLRECHRILRGRGCLIVSVPNCVSLSYRLAWVFGRVPSCAAAGNLPAPLGMTSYRSADGGTVAGHVIDFNLARLKALLIQEKFTPMCVRGNGLYWHRQWLPAWALPARLASNLIVKAVRVGDDV